MARRVAALLPFLSASKDSTTDAAVDRDLPSRSSPRRRCYRSAVVALARLRRARRKREPREQKHQSQESLSRRRQAAAGDQSAVGPLSLMASTPFCCGPGRFCVPGHLGSAGRRIEARRPTSRLSRNGADQRPGRRRADRANDEDRLHVDPAKCVGTRGSCARGRLTLMARSVEGRGVASTVATRRWKRSPATSTPANEVGGLPDLCVRGACLFVGDRTPARAIEISGSRTCRCA